MIVGVGTDLVNTDRIAELVERTGQRFAQKILCEAEMVQFETHSNPVAFLAKRFAAKEATAKALGTGIGKVALKDIQIFNNEQGAPGIIAGETVLAQMKKIGAKHLHLSIADEQNTAIAFVVAEG